MFLIMPDTAHFREVESISEEDARRNFEVQFWDRCML
jgi:hypothetical protein